MGDADVGGGGGASSLDSGDAGSLAASRALMEGGSLPPRKRLLAGLKQNGWLSTSPPPAESPTAGAYASAQAVGVSVGGVVRSGSGKFEEGLCMGCNAVESNGLRRIKRGGVSLRLCSACTLLYSKSMFCPHCLAMYHDASLLGDPSMWLVCTRCRRSVHPECEQKHSGSTPDVASYVCLDCVNSARRQREANGVTGMRSKHSSGRPVPNFHGETGSGASAALAGDFVSPALKKPRLHRERSAKPGDHERGDGSRFERHRPAPDAAGGTGVAKAASLGPPRKVSSQASLEAASPQEAAVAARNAATAAVKLAAAAKVNAAAKAGVAVKAAAAAKTALEAAAHAAKAEAACRAELRRKRGNSETRLTERGAMRLEINVHSEPRRERSAKGEMKYERDDGYVPRRAGAGSVDDEELARQLHRVINSSPRISRSMTPMRRKQSVKPETPSSGVSNSSAETVRARPRTSVPFPIEPVQEQVQVQHEHEQQHHQFRHQQTRPRSITHKEFRRIDSRVSRHEVKMAEGNGQEGERVGGLEPSSQEAALSHMGSQPAEELTSAVKSEAMDGVMFAPEVVHDDASILFDALVEADGEGMHAAGGRRGSHDRRPDYLQEILEAAVLTDTAMFDDGAHVVVSDLETVRPEPVAAEQGQEALGMSGLQVDESEAGPKDADGDAGDATAGEATSLEASKAMVGEATEAMVGEATDTMAEEASEAMAGEATEAIAGEATEAMAGEATEAMAGEATEAMAGEATEAMTGEATDAMAGEARDTVSAEAGYAIVGEAAMAMAVEATTLGQDEEKESTVVPDVEMQEVGGVDAAPVGGKDGMPGPLSTIGTRVEERSGGEAAEKTGNGTDASMPCAVGAEVPSMGLEETKSGAPVSEAQAASGGTSRGSVSQQSG